MPALLAACVFLAACGSTAGGAPPAPTAAERVVLALRHHGKTVQVARGSRVTLVLPERWRWSTPRVRGAAVRVTEVVSDAPTGGRQWELRPREAGRAVLTTRGSPACRPATPGCPAARGYVVTLVVR